jgi:hypothetical protein
VWKYTDPNQQPKGERKRLIRNRHEQLVIIFRGVGGSEEGISAIPSKRVPILLIYDGNHLFFLFHSECWPSILDDYNVNECADLNGVIADCMACTV